MLPRGGCGGSGAGDTDPSGGANATSPRNKLHPEAFRAGTNLWALMSLTKAGI